MQRELTQTVGNRGYVIKKPSFRINDRWYKARLDAEVDFLTNPPPLDGPDVVLPHHNRVSVPDRAVIRAQMHPDETLAVSVGDVCEIECRLQQPNGVWHSYVWQRVKLIEVTPADGLQTLIFESTGPHAVPSEQEIEY